MEEGYGDFRKRRSMTVIHQRLRMKSLVLDDCISEAHDLDENGNVAHMMLQFEEYIVKGVPVEDTGNFG